ncbi:hypothetical protein DM02DRAFT_672748 [Periconia macrospinosa]|uniref:Uncharacterized protein n=1 Tax=Periconia macrospinosa TaxID=97972 RepID=A0A2V1DMD3_9PLEO|nr:hypothetical protein DM02DRAFT_672748 [Periconia macrospinosa]
MGHKPSKPHNPQSCLGPILYPGCNYNFGPADTSVTGDKIQHIPAGPHMFDGKVYGLTPDICPAMGGSWEPDNKCLVNLNKDLCDRYHGVWDPANGGACGISYEQVQRGARASSGHLAVRGLKYEPPMDVLTLGLYINLILCIVLLSAGIGMVFTALMKVRRVNRDRAHNADQVSDVEIGDKQDKGTSCDFD